MRRKVFRWAAIAQICLVLFTGCHPTQPFFIRNDPSMANFMDQAMSIEYADVQVESLPEASQAQPPFGPDRVPEDFVDLSLEDCIAIALQNSKILRITGGANSQSGSVAAALLSAPAGQMPSVYDPAITASTGNTQPLAVDNQGNRINPRGAFRANQVGGVEDALSEFDTQFSALFGYSTTDRPRNVGQGNVFNPQLFQGVDSNAQAALSKRLATGTVVTSRFTNIYSRNNIPASGNAPGSPNFGRAVPSDYTAAMELQVTQPLMRGRGTLVNRIPVVLARINEDISLHEFEANVRNLVKSVEDAYWDLYIGYRAYETAKVARESALDLWRVAEDRTTFSDGSPQAVAQAKGLYFQFQAQVNASLYGSTIPGNDPNGLYGREQVLREKMGWSSNDNRMIRPADEPTAARVQFDWYDIWPEALTRNTELRRQKWAIKQRELELISARNQLLPQLDLSATYSWLGVGDHFAAADRRGLGFPNPGSTALEELTGGDYQEVSAQLEFTPQPIGKRRAMANIQSSQFQIKKAQEELREKEMFLSHELHRALRNMESSQVLMKDNLDQWQAITEEIQVYDDQIEAGAGAELSQLLDSLLRAEERRARAQLQYYQALGEYNKSLVNVHYYKGSLLDLNNISLGEGAWVEKAYWDAEERSRERAGGHYFDYGYTRPSVVSRGDVPQSGAIGAGMSDSGMYWSEAADGGAYPEGSFEDAEEVPFELYEPEANGSSKQPQPRGSGNGSEPNGQENSGAQGPTAQRPTGGSLQPASATRHADNDTFDWGAVASGSQSGGRAAPTISRTSQRQAVSSQPRRSASQATGDQPGDSYWRSR